MYIEYSWPHMENLDHRNLEIRKTRNDFSVQVRTFLLPLSLKVLRLKERDTIFLCWLFHLAPISRGVRNAQIRLASASAKSRTSSFGVKLQLSNFLQNLPKTSARFQCVTSLALCYPVPHLGLLWHLWVTRPLCASARVNTCIKFAPN